MSFSGICKIFFLFLAIQWAGLTLKADSVASLDHPCKTTADCPKDSWTRCCNGKCVSGEGGCCPGEGACGPLCCPKDQRCDMTAMKCVPDYTCQTGKVMCQGTSNPVGNCCKKDLCSSSGQCCLEEEETVCGEGCCAHGQCTTTGKCCQAGDACKDVCCPSDKPFCVHGKCTAFCDKENPCPSPYICAEATCCPEGSSSKLCGGACCSEASICVNGQCQACKTEEKACPCPSGKGNCRCIPVFESCKHGCPTGNVLCGGVCMNPLDRICVKGKVQKCPIKSIVNLIKKNTCTPCPPNEFSVRSQNKCKTCPANNNNIIVNNTCTACPSGEMAVNAPVEEAYNYGYCCNTVAAGAQSCCKTEGIFYKNQCYGRECYNRCAAALNYYNHCLYVKCPVYHDDSFRCTLKCYELYMSATWAAERWIPKCECMPNTRNKLPIYGSISSIEAELKAKENDTDTDTDTESKKE